MNTFGPKGENMIDIVMDKQQQIGSILTNVYTEGFNDGKQKALIISDDEKIKEVLNKYHNMLVKIISMSEKERESLFTYRTVAAIIEDSTPEYIIDKIEEYELKGE